MEFLIIFGIIFVVVCTIWYSKQKGSVRNIQIQARAQAIEYLKMYNHLRHLMTYASKDDLYHETIRQVLKKHLYGHDYSNIATHIVRLTDYEIAHGTIDAQDKFLFIVTGAIFHTLVYSHIISKSYLEGDKLPHRSLTFETISREVVDIIPPTL